MLPTSGTGEIGGEITYRLTALGGFFVLLGAAWITGGRKRVSPKTILPGILLAWGLGLLTFWFPPTRLALAELNDALIAVLEASMKGVLFLLGPLAIGPGQMLPDGTPSVGFILAAQMLPAVIFFSAVTSALYYLGVMQKIVRLFAWLFHRFLRLSGAESLSGSANIFFGIESGLLVRPYLERMTRSELLTIMTCMMATVASTVMAVYVFTLKDVIPGIAGHLVSASILSIPCAVLVSKLFLPESLEPVTMGHVPSDSVLDDKPSENLMMALIEGGNKGVQLAVGIAVLLIVLLGLEAVADLGLSLLPPIAGAPLSLERIMGWLAAPFVVLMGLRPEEWSTAAQILGARFIETEVTAYFTLDRIQDATHLFSPRSLIALMYSLCGFVHLASLGIYVGGLSTLAPSRAKEISVLGLRALWLAFLATTLTGCIASVLAN